MAVAAFLAVLTLVNVRVLVAAVTFLRCLVVFLLGFMARIAGRSGMCAFELEIGLRVVKVRGVQQDDYCLSAFMFGMTVLAVLLYAFG